MSTSLAAKFSDGLSDCFCHESIRGLTHKCLPKEKERRYELSAFFVDLGSSSGFERRMIASNECGSPEILVCLRPPLRRQLRCSRPRLALLCEMYVVFISWGGYLVYDRVWRPLLLLVQ
jgi:hypothetical protein